MNLHETIDQLEQEATKYAEAANALRALLPQGSGRATDGTAQAPAPDAGKAARGSQTRDDQPRARKTRNLSPETRARMADAMRERHRQRREAKAAQEAQGFPE